MVKSDIRKAKARLAKIRQLMSKVRTTHKAKTKQQIINQIRKIREKLWEAKLAPRAR